MQKIITIGGGTGHFQLLKGLKNYECELTAIVNVSDNGGSSGRLRDEYGVLPPGDVRQCMVALAREDRQNMLRDLFNYRLKDGHSLGNLIITALTKTRGGEVEGIKAASRLLEIEGKVLPVTVDSNMLIGETSDGKLLRGEVEVNYPEDPKTKIIGLSHEPETFLYKEVADEISKADKIVICPGCLYGSILPNFIVGGMQNALEKSKAKKILVCNLFTKQGEYDFRTGDYLREVERYSGVKMDSVIVNTGRPADEVIEKYFSENSKLVEDDLSGDGRILRGDFSRECLSEEKTILRHAPEKIARVIIGL